MSVFSPLALTQTLPFLPLAQGDIDYEAARRGEPDLSRQSPGGTGNESHPRQRPIGGKVAVPHGQGAIADYANVKNAPRSTAGRVRCRGTRIAPIGARHIPRLVRRTIGRARRRRGRDARPAERYDDYGCDGSQRGERTTRSPKCRRTNRRKTRNRCWKARQPDSTGWTCADSHPTPAHAKPDRQPPPSRSACGTPGSVTARRAARPSNRRSAAGLSTARTMRMAIVCCSPESSQR